MPTPSLSPPASAASTTVILTSTGSTSATEPAGAGNTSNYFLGIYADTDSALYDANFISGASDQVAYTNKKLSGSVISPNLSFPRFEFRYARRIGEGVSREANVGGAITMHSSSFKVNKKQQDYDLQTIIANNAAGTDPASGDVPDYAGLVGNKKITIRRVFYKTPRSVWRFYGYYGGLNVVGNLNNYGQFADDTTFELIPAWQNKLQAMAYEDHMFTRLSHYSYEIYNNKLRLFPTPNGEFPGYMWVQFNVETDGWTEESDRKHGVDGINNMNALPFDNIPYKNINAIGKHWIRRYALALTMGMLAQVRGKFGSIPIPGESVTLNAGDLATLSGNDIQSLKEELKTVLDEMTYRAIAEKDAAMMVATSQVLEDVPLLIYQG